MKLVDILARELKEWPERASHACSYFWDWKAHVSFTKGGAPAPDPNDRERHTWTTLRDARKTEANWLIGFDLTLSIVPEDRKTAIVTRAQWQTAVEALKSPSLHIQQIGRITRQQEAIDWPEWATHRLTTGPKWDGDHSMLGSIEFAILRGDSYHDQWDGEFDMDDSSWVVLDERPAILPWNGEGLPPVGVTCEFEGSVSGAKAWKQCLVIAHDGQYAVINYKNNYSAHLPGSFRPLRTAEQIAAEEREAEIAAMIDLFRFSDDKQEMLRAVCVSLHNAGYRKQEQPK